MDGIQLALMRGVCAEQCLKCACLLDLAGEHCWVRASSSARNPSFAAFAVILILTVVLNDCSHSINLEPKWLRFLTKQFPKRCVWAPFGFRSRSVRAPFELRLGQNFWSLKFLISKKINLCDRRRRGGGPLAAVPSAATWRAPAAAARAAQIENF